MWQNWFRAERVPPTGAAGLCLVYLFLFLHCYNFSIQVTLLLLSKVFERDLVPKDMLSWLGSFLYIDSWNKRFYFSFQNMHTVKINHLPRQQFLEHSKSSESSPQTSPAIIIVGAFKFPFGISGITDASATLKFLIPKTLKIKIENLTKGN